MNAKISMFNKERLAAFDRSNEQHPGNFMEGLDGDDDDSIGLGSQDAPSSQFMDDMSGYNTDVGTSSHEGTNQAISRALSDVESQKVFRLRMAVIGVLILAALAVSAAVFKITVQGEMDEFATQYEGAAGKVVDSFANIMNKMGSVAGLGVSYTSQGQHHSDNHHDDSTSIWPLVTLEDFPPRARNVLQLSGALMVGLSPVLEGNWFQEWDEYVNDPENQEWINQSLAYQKARGMDYLQYQERVEQNTIDSSRIVDAMHYFLDGQVYPESNGSDWYLPTWQTSPYVREGLVNNNLIRYENTTEELQRLLSTGSAVASPMFSAPPGDMNSTDPDTALLATLRSAQAGAPVEYVGDPMTNFYVPVFDEFVGLRRKVVGVLTAMIHWKSYFDNVLPQSIQGVVVVLEYRCGATGSGSEDAPEQVTNQRRAQKQVQTKTTTFTIIDVSDFNVVTEVPSTATTTNYWNSDAHTDPPAASNSYWDVNAHSTPPPNAESTGNPYWDPDAHSTTPPTTSYWNAAIQTTPVPSSGSTTSYWNADARSTPPPSPEETTSYWNVDAHNNNSPPPAVPSREDNDTFADDTEVEAQKLEEEPVQRETQYFSYIIEGTEARMLGYGDLHDPAYDDWMRQGTFDTTLLDDGTITGIPVDQSCSYTVYVYPSTAFYTEYITSTPLIITLVVAAVFIFAIIIFLFYNRLVERRQRRILQKATQSTAIVSSLFPKNVRDRLLAGGDGEGKGSRFDLGTKSRLKGFMAGETNEADNEAAPIADLFPHCTVFFGDIAGFTAWSSTREPSQVFILLQNVYQAFDQLAKRRRVFKVETIGDSYMAVTGLPDPQDSHASIMVRFAYDCLVKMREVTKDLESSLGPDTTELSMRIGLHSGPVTAGVLRGDRARFQLFGDTVNTASRMESTGTRGKIQVSEATAAILRANGREYWLQPRSDSVKAKGKGVLKTYWANPKFKHNSASGSWETGSSDPGDDETDSTDEASDALPQAHLRLVDWIVKLMSDDVRKILFARPKGLKASKQAPTYVLPEGKTCMDEVKEVIHMPKYDAKQAIGDEYKRIQIDPAIVRDLGEYVTGVAKMYRSNPFHSFEHACHVTMSVNKLIRRIVTPELASEGDGDNHVNKLLHDYTYGITSDPLAMFAMTFSALIHDADHRGISNMQLGTEDPEMKEKYHNKSLAEQNSLDLAWDLLMEDRFANLRRYLFVNEAELLRFRQLIVNIVLATDIFDAELNGLRKNRWKRAFAGEQESGEDVITDRSDLRATIVIEHIIQASDVSHTMQHWHVYQKWNKCLFREMYAAFKAGRLAKDPASFWYKGEIGFFDNYIIPLAKKLKDCGVFGVSSDEYLNYAEQNRAEWEERGQEIVAMLVDEVTAGEEEGEETAPASRPSGRRHSTGAKSLPKAEN